MHIFQLIFSIEEIFVFSGADMWKNRALYDKSMKRGTWLD